MRNKNIFGKEMAAMSEETLFEKLGVKYIEKDGIFYPLITSGGEENSTDVGKYGRMWMDYMYELNNSMVSSVINFYHSDLADGLKNAHYTTRRI